jgi:signal peptidase I
MYTDPTHQTGEQSNSEQQSGRSYGRQPDNEGLRSILSTIAILLIAPFIAVLLTVFVFQSYQVDGPSMERTLFNNDRLIVWKLSRTWARVTHQSYIPRRGDIIVFTEPALNQFGQDPGKQLIKRVIGLPGDRVVIKDDVVTVYNSKHPSGFHPDTDLPYDRTAKDTAGDIDITIPSKQVFVLGDNRTNSLDSRAFGTVDSRNIIGKLAVRVLPIGDMKRF